VEIIVLGILVLLIIIAWNIKTGFQIVEIQLQKINDSLNNKKE